MFMPKPKHTPVRTFTVEEDGFYGAYYEPEINKFPGKAMVICSGSDGKYLFVQLGADKFCDAGMPVIALSYFNTPGTPESCELSPVEYMHRAVLWLKNKGYHVGVWGISLGGEYVLLCGSLFPEIECVVAAAPVHIVSRGGSFVGGLHFAKASPFSHNGSPVPHIPISDAEAEAFLARMKKNMRTRLEPDILFYYEDLLRRPHDPAADIRVENINGPVLLLSGEQDVMVPAKWVCRQVVKRLEENNFAHPCLHKNYDPMSHYVAPFRPITTPMFRIERSHKKACNANREQSWQDTLDFLRDTWQIK